MVGIDLVFVPEFQAQLQVGGDIFIEKAFQATEYIRKEPEHLAGLWAAKEAVCKAMAIPPASWRDIHISHDALGKPHAMVGDESFALSIAHHGEYAVAVAMKVAP